MGYSEETKAWDLIVKYTGSLQKYASDIVQIVELYNEYAIITVPENMVEAVSDWPEVEYIENQNDCIFKWPRERGPPVFHWCRFHH